MIRAPTREQSVQDTKKVQAVLQRFGFSVNQEKSTLNPTQRLEHLEVVIDTVKCRLILPYDKANVIKSLTLSTIQGTSTSLMSLAKLVGLMISTIDTIQWARLHSRALQHLLRPYQAHIIQKAVMNIQIQLLVKENLVWWTHLPNLTRGKPFWIPEKIQIFTDATGLGSDLWRIHCTGDLVPCRKEIIH